MRANGAVDGGARGFVAGDRVIVQRSIDVENRTHRVLGQVSGKRTCKTDNGYYLFYKGAARPPATGDVIKIALCRFADGTLSKIDAKDQADVGFTSPATPITMPITMHLKKFKHMVPTMTYDASGNPKTAVRTLRDLYFIATSLVINPNPHLGWTNFKNANSSFPLVTNRSDSKIPMTTQLMSDMTSVNTEVNTTHAYASDPAGNDYWHILGEGEAGDCEDFALTKAKKLLDLGYPASAIHIETGKIDGLTSGHAWCVVQTHAGNYALDTSSNAPVINSSIKPPTLDPPLVTPAEYTGRRRQIGNNWAFVSPYGWLGSTQNLEMPATVWYVLDPLLNIFYTIGSWARAYPFAQIRDLDGTAWSTPSINFSEDNTAIHVAEQYNASLGARRSYRLDENVLTYFAFSYYTAKHGYVGRNGAIEAPIGTYGREDYNAYGGSYNNMYITLWNGKYYLCRITPERCGDFRCVYGNGEVISKDGYYEYKYRYLEGSFVCERDICALTGGGFVDGDGSSWGY